MRAIKFRAHYQPLGTVYDVSEIMWSSETVCLINEEEDYREEPLDSVDLLQFTGLKDKNGKEIYEGNIVEIEGGKEYCEADPSWSRQYRGIVQWPEGDCCFDIDRTLSGKDRGGHDLAFLAEHLEVIGNIYEDPGLLK